MTGRALTRQECREIDRYAIDVLGIPGLVLMENAGRGCVDVLEKLGINGPVVILCGKGNNAGDGFVIARHLDIRGYECRVVLLKPASELRGDAAANFAILRKTSVPIVDFGVMRETFGRAGAGSGDPRTTTMEGSRTSNEADWLVDAMLGTGALGEPRPPFDAAIEWMNGQSAKKLAVDVPSGLDCDTGQPAMHTIRADHTCTFAAMKIGYLQPSAKAFTGEVHVCDIGVPESLF